MSRPYAWRILRVFLQDCVCLIAPQTNNSSTLPKFWSTSPKTASCSAKECRCSKECQCKLRGLSQYVHLPRQEYPGQFPKKAMLRGGRHAIHHPLSLPYSTGPCRMGRRYEARRRQRQQPLPAQPVDVALRPGAGAQGLDSGRGRRLFAGGAGQGCGRGQARRARGAGEGSRARGSGEGRPGGQAPAAGSIRPCGCFAVIHAGSRRASRLYSRLISFAFRLQPRKIVVRRRQDPHSR